MKKTHVFPNTMLLIGGRLYLLLSLAFLPILWIILVSDFSVLALILIIILTITFGICEIIVIRFLWHQCFGEILVTEHEIVYFGIFLPTIKLKFDNIKYVDIRTFDEGNVMYHKNGSVIDAYKFILLSEKPISRKRIDKIRPSKKNRLIKYAVSEKLCRAIVDKLPELQSRIVDYQLMLYNKAK